MTTKEVSQAIKNAGFSTKKEFAQKMGLSVVAVNMWGSKSPIPPYFFQVLEWAKKAKMFDEMVKNLNNVH